MNSLVFTAGMQKNGSAFDEFAGFYRWDAKKQAGWTHLFFCDQAVLKRIQPTEKSIGCWDRCGGSSWFYFVGVHPTKKILRVGGKQVALGITSGF